MLDHPKLEGLHADPVAAFPGLVSLWLNAVAQ
jgi:hypothetical protein